VRTPNGLIELPARSIDDGLELLRRTAPVHDERHVDDTSGLVLRTAG
jgi:hypothetical protein